MRTTRITFILSLLTAASSLLSAWSSSFDDPKPRFQSLSVEHGLSQSSVFCMLQDSDGFLWLGTRDGLNRFDGYEYKVFKASLKQEGSIAGNLIVDLLQTDDGTIWVACGDGGLSRYNPRTESFTNFLPDRANPQSISSEQVQALAKDNKGHIWIGTRSGLNRFDPINETFETYSSRPDFPAELIFDIAMDQSRNRLWIGTRNQGLYCYHIDEDRFEALLVPHLTDQPLEIEKLLLHSDELLVGTVNHGLLQVQLEDHTTKVVLNRSMAPNLINSNRVYALYSDDRQQVWVSFELSGIARLDSNYQIQANYSKVEDEPGGLASNTIRSILTDRIGLVWLGTDGGGVSKLDPRALAFQNRLQKRIIRSIYETDEGELWVGTYGDTLYRFMPETVAPRNYELPEVNGQSINTVLTITRPQRGRILIGTDGLGIWEFIPEEDRFQMYAAVEGARFTIPDNHVYKIVEDRQGMLWVGTETYGLFRLNPRTGEVKGYPTDLKDPKKLQGNQIWAIVEDSQNRFWIGTANAGLHLLDREKGTITNFRHEPGNSNGISGNNVKCIFEGDQGMLWVGTTQGLNRFDVDKLLWTTYREGEHLPNGVVYSVMQTEPDKLWLSTNNGLVLFQPSDESYTHFTYEDGLQSNEYNTAAYFQNDAGRLFYGGINGLTTFDPQDIPIDNTAPQVVFTQFLINNKPVPIGTQIPNTDVVLEQSLNFTQSLTLPYTQNMFSIDFAGLHFANPNQNQYEFRMHGWDQVWLSSEADHRRATYSGLPAGTYRFQVRASNRDKIWNNEGRELVLRILPPAYWTWWAKALYVVAFFCILFYFLRRYQRELERQRNLAEERRVLAEKERNLARDLEQLVNERTRDLKEKNLQMEILDEMARTINRETSLSSFVNRVLEITQFIHFVERARILYRLPGSEDFEFYDVMGRNDQRKVPRCLSNAEFSEKYLRHADSMGEDLYLRLHRDASGEITRSNLILHLQNEEQTLGYLLFENETHPEAFQAQDLTLLRRLKAHLVSAFVKNCMLEELEEANQRKNEFLGIAAHDLRSPLQGIVLSAEYLEELLDEQKLDKVDYKDVLHRVLDAAGKMVHLLDELLDISAIESGKVNLKLEPLTIGQSVQDVLKHFSHAAKEKNIKLEHDQQNMGEQVLADHYKLNEILDNLVSNAIKYTQPNGEVKVSVEVQSSHLVTHISDSGQGLTEEDLSKVFQSFQRLSARPTGGESSTGLGLAIVKKTVEAHGGKVWVSSKPGAGAVFSFSLPRTAN